MKEDNSLEGKCRKYGTAVQGEHKGSELYLLDNRDTIKPFQVGDVYDHRRKWKEQGSLLR